MAYFCSNCRIRPLITIFLLLSLSTASSGILQSVSRRIIGPINDLYAWAKKTIRTSKDPEIKLSIEGIIRRWGYPVESHKIITSDDYILTAFRIPHGKHETLKMVQNGKKRPVVLFMHGLDASSVCFISNLPTKDAAYLFADGGIDVWLGNFRGNKYSNGHKTKRTKFFAGDYWKFGWDEMAAKDLPAIIDYILNETKSEFLYYVGHSMGTTTAFALLSSSSVFEKKIREVYALGPVTTGHNITGSARNACDMISKVDKKGIKPGSFVSNYALAKQMVKLTCTNSAIHRVLPRLCEKTIFLTEGEDTGQLNKTRIPVFMAHLPAGTSWRTVAHFAQTVKSGNFSKYDYGTEGNVKNYGHATPPLYDLGRVKTPVVLFSGDKDYLATPTDVHKILTTLGNVRWKHLEGYNHVDFIWGKKAASDIYLPMRKEILDNFRRVIDEDE